MLRIKLRVSCGTFAALALLCLTAIPVQAQTRPTESGPVQGLTTGDVVQFRGIPYAAPPVDTLRWRPPAKPMTWKGTRNATDFRPACPQQFSAYPTSEDCLTLSIYAPVKATATSKLPVMVWIHGGGFISGSGRDFGGSAMVERGGLLVVTINYRLGYLGFLAHPALSAADPHHVSGNYGVLDQQAAIAWVRRNIAGFGGDPGHITIFGESAGGQSVIDQLISPTVGPLSAAIAQSGSYMTTLPTLATSEVSGQAAAKSLGCPDQTAACLYALSAKTIADALNPLSGLGGVTAVVDGRTIPRGPAQAFAEGKFQHIPVINGSNHDEYRLFIGLDRLLLKTPPLTAETYAAKINGQFGGFAASVLAAYPAKNYAQADYAYAAVLTDVAFACNAHMLNALMARHTKVFEYELNDPNAPVASGPVISGFSYGSPHSADLSYFFPTYNVKAFHPDGPPALTGPQERLRASMQYFWVNMASNGDPKGGHSVPWPAFTDGAPVVMSLHPPLGSTTLGFPADHHCALWKPILLGEAGLKSNSPY